MWMLVQSLTGMNVWSAAVVSCRLISYISSTYALAIRRIWSDNFMLRVSNAIEDFWLMFNRSICGATPECLLRRILQYDVATVLPHYLLRSILSRV
jgi:hypothetical protein